MDRRHFIRTAAGLFVAQQLGIEVIPWKRRFFPGSDIARGHWVTVKDMWGEILTYGDPAQPIQILVSGIADRVVYREFEYRLHAAQPITAGGTVSVQGLDYRFIGT